MVLLLGGMVLYLHLVARLIWQVLHVLSSARGVFEGLNYFRKIGAREKGGGGGISSVLFIFLPPPIYEVVAFHLLSCVCSPVWSFYMVLLKCVELKCVAFYLPCVRFILFVICGAACFLIMRYRANSSPFLLQAVHIRQRAWFYMLLCSTRPY